MAGNVDFEKTKKSREILKALECPYIEGLDEQMMHSFLMSSGGARLRLIEWLLEKYQPQILLRQSLVPSASTSPRSAKLSHILSDMSICLPHETNLIKGTCGEKRSFKLLESLIELVHTSRQMKSPHYESSLSFNDSSSPAALSSMTTSRISQEMSQRCHFIDSLCRRGNLTLINPPPISLVPVTVGHVMNADKSCDNRKELIPSLSELSLKVKELREELSEKEQQLQETEKEYSYTPIDHRSLLTCLQLLQVSFSTLSQLIDDFSYQYQSDISQWTDSSIKSINAFGDLGPSSNRLHSHLLSINQLLENASKLETVTKSLIELGGKGVMAESNKGKLLNKAHQNFQEQIDKFERERN